MRRFTICLFKNPHAGLDECKRSFRHDDEANQTPGLANNLTTFRRTRSLARRSRVKRKHDVPLSNIFGTLQTYLGSTYVNDLTAFAALSVTAQTDSQFRLGPTIFAC